MFAILERLCHTTALSLSKAGGLPKYRTLIMPHIHCITYVASADILIGIQNTCKYNFTFLRCVLDLIENSYYGVVVIDITGYLCILQVSDVKKGIHKYITLCMG